MKVARTFEPGAGMPFFAALSIVNAVTKIDSPGTCSDLSTTARKAASVPLWGASREPTPKATEKTLN